MSENQDNSEFNAMPADDQTAGSVEVDKLKAERDMLFEKLARVQADYKNSHRRMENDFEQRMAFANSTLISSMLPVIDNFERALSQDSSKTDAASIQKGLQLVHDQLMDVLRRFNVEIVSPEPGTPFDPSRHQAVMQQPSDQYTEPTVTQLFQNGYIFNGRPLRPASVAVSVTNS